MNEPQKATLQMLGEGWQLDVVFQAQAEGVDIPKEQRVLYLDKPMMVQIGLSMARPMPDLLVDDHGIEGTMSFNGQPYRVVIPWVAILIVVDSVTQQKGFICNREAFMEISQGVGKAMVGEISQAKATMKPKPRPPRNGLRLIQGGKRDE